MKEIRIAVIADIRGFKQLLNDNSTFKEPELPYIIKFIHIYDEEKCMGTYFHSYILNWSAIKNIEDYWKIVERVKTRIIEIR